jgi:GNAT superfamily N-acetyltransferase
MKQIDNSSITLRLATVEDIKQIIQLQFDSIRALCAQDYNQRELEALLLDKSKGRHWSEEIIFVAETEAKIVGFAGLSRWNYLGNIGTITGLFVAPQFARQRIGTLLINKIEATALERKIAILRVFSSLTGNPFYLHQGYHWFDRSWKSGKSIALAKKAYIKLDYGVQIPCILMEKVLTPPTFQATIWNHLYKLFIVTAILLLLIAIIT